MDCNRLFAVVADSTCDLDKDLKRTPDKKAIKKWVEEEVLLHPSAVHKSRVHFP